MYKFKLSSRVITEINMFRDMIMLEEYKKTVYVGAHDESYFIEGYEGLMKQIHLN